MEPYSLTTYKRTFLPEAWKTLDYLTIINLCLTSKEYLEICQNPETWIYLLKRDFKITWDLNNQASPREYYELHYSYFIRGDFMRQILRRLNKAANSSSKKPQTWLFSKDETTVGRADIKVIRGNNIYEIIFKIIFNGLMSEREILYDITNILPLNIALDINREMENSRARQPQQASYTPIDTPCTTIETYINTSISTKPDNATIETHDYDHDEISDTDYSSGNDVVLSFNGLIDVILDSVVDSGFLRNISRLQVIE